MHNLCLKPLFFIKKAIYRASLFMTLSTKVIVHFYHLEQRLEGVLNKYAKLFLQIVDSIL